jgi:hypothetical protein
MACQSLAVLLFTFAEPSSGLFALVCMNEVLGVSGKVRGIYLIDSE